MMRAVYTVPKEKSRKSVCEFFLGGKLFLGKKVSPQSPLQKNYLFNMKKQLASDT